MGRRGPRGDGVADRAQARQLCARRPVVNMPGGGKMDVQLESVPSVLRVVADRIRLAKFLHRRPKLGGMMVRIAEASVARRTGLNQDQIGIVTEVSFYENRCTVCFPANHAWRGRPEQLLRHPGLEMNKSRNLLVGDWVSLSPTLTKSRSGWRSGDMRVRHGDVGTIISVDGDGAAVVYTVRWPRGVLRFLHNELVVARKPPG